MLETIASLSGVNNNLVGVDPKFNNETTPAGFDNNSLQLTTVLFCKAVNPLLTPGLTQPLAFDNRYIR
jgi:hypothetical protein